MRGFILFMFCSVVALVLSACKSRQSLTQQELTRRTQELFDSVAGGDQAPWRKYFTDDSMYFDEVGKDKNKAAVVADVAPLPPGYSGSIRVVNVKSHIENDIAIMSYDLDEKESVFGQELTARYHATDTWMRRRSWPARSFDTMRIPPRAMSTIGVWRIMSAHMNWLPGRR
jgi:hypothetical protein